MLVALQLVFMSYPVLSMPTVISKTQTDFTPLLEIHETCPLFPQLRVHSISTSFDYKTACLINITDE